MCSALLQTPRLVLIFIAVTIALLYLVLPAFSRSCGHEYESPLIGTESVCAQVVSPSGYRYDTPGNPYNNYNYVAKTPTAHTTTFLPSGYSLNPYVKPYAPNPSTQFSANANQYGPSSVSGSLPTSLPGAPATTLPFPQYNPLPYQRSAAPYYNYKAQFQRLTPAELHEKTIWSAATSDEESMLARIQEQQLSAGPDHPATLQYMMETANYFAQEQKPNLAEPLLKEIIATIQSRPLTLANSTLLSAAQARLAQLQAEDTRVAATPVIDPSTVYVSRPYVPISYGSNGWYGGGGRSYGHSYHGHSMHISFHSVGGHSSIGHIRCR